MSSYGKITHCIFDMDGVIIDTESQYTDAIRTVTERYGKNYTLEIKAKSMGRTSRECAMLIIDSLNLPLTIEQFLKELEIEYRRVFQDISLLPGITHILDHLYKHNIPMAVATGSKKWTYDLKVEQYRDLFNKYFHHIVCASDDPEVKFGKPHPDPYLVCRKRFDPPIPSPEQILVFEDSPSGVKSAIAAGMKCVMIPDSRLSQFNDSTPTLIIDSFFDFDPILFGLPPFDN